MADQPDAHTSNADTNADYPQDVIAAGYQDIYDIYRAGLMSSGYWDDNLSPQAFVWSIPLTKQMLS